VGTSDIFVGRAMGASAGAGAGAGAFPFFLGVGSTALALGEGAGAGRGAERAGVAVGARRAERATEPLGVLWNAYPTLNPCVSGSNREKRLE